MNRATASFLKVGLIFVIVMLVITTYISTYNQAVLVENSIITQHKQMSNIHAQYTTKVKEAAQVPEMYANDLKNIVVQEMTAKMGPNGSGALHQWFNERNITLDADMYKRIMQIIELGRDEIKNSQSVYLDMVNGYVIKRESLVSGFILRITGFPSNKYIEGRYDTFVLLNADTKKAFTTGIEEPVQLR